MVVTSDANGGRTETAVGGLPREDRETLGRIAIVGGGIGGLATALALRRAGLGSEVFEMASEKREIGAGIQLGPNTVRLLQRFGLTEQLREMAIRPEVVWEYRRWEDGRVLFQQSFGDEDEATFGAPYYVVHRADLLNLLAEAVPDEAVHLNSRVTGLTQDINGVELSFEDGSTERADLVIGCDGIRSTVREAVVDSAPARFSGLCSYRGLIPIDQAPELAQREVVTVWLGPGRHFVHYPVSAGKLVNVVGTVPAGEWREETWSAPGRVEDLAAEFADWHEQVRQVIEAIDETSIFALHDREPLERWSNGRVVLLGDAAHAMIQFFAQGAGQAIEDAVILAGCLREAGGGDMEAITAALERYEAIRRPRATKVQQLSRTRGEAWPKGEGWHLPDGPEQRERDERFAEADPLSTNAWLYGHDVEDELPESAKITQ
jgi:salicylate hydroxylase